MSDAWIGFAGSLVGGIFVLLGVILSQRHTRNNYAQSAAPFLILRMKASRTAEKAAVIHVDFTTNLENNTKREVVAYIENSGLGAAKALAFENFKLLGMQAEKAYFNPHIGMQPFEIPQNTAFVFSIAYVYSVTDTGINTIIEELKTTSNYEDSIENGFECTLNYHNVYGDLLKKKITGTVRVQRHNPELDFTTYDGVEITGLMFGGIK